LRVWPLWERLARRIWRTVPIPNAPHGALDVYFGRYHGEPIVLSDGTPIQPGDRVIELHTNNLVVLDAVQGSRWHILRVLEGDLRALAAWVSQPDFSPDVQAIYAVTVLGRGATWLGFHLRDRPPGLRARLDRLFMAGLLAIYTSEGFDRLSRGKTFGPYPQEMWMSRAELLRRYGETTT
jgi:hypothetical protein